ncbi:unnamed protein product [Phytomonas sp. Hart1]|nr:unnamed protein product [Phytomonas sp. Hart1]|eukprot:CCW69527.1 unnamed protein product [Phytomonas sp. isolate Hart1]
MWPDESAMEGPWMAWQLKDWRARRMRRMRGEVNRQNAYNVLASRYGQRIFFMPNLVRHLAEANRLCFASDEDEPDIAETTLLTEVAMTIRRENQMLGSLTPVCDGPLAINIIAKFPSSRTPATTSSRENEKPVKNEETPHNCKKDQTEDLHDIQLLGTFRQSLLLIHFKVYCCALHDEVQQRHDGHLLNLENVQTQHAHSIASSTANEKKLFSRERVTSTGKKTAKRQNTEDDSVLLAEVPHIPRPILRLQEGELPLLNPHKRNTPNLSHVQPARCWVGLFPTPQDLLLPNSVLDALHIPQMDPSERKELQQRTLQTWNYLHTESVIARQAVRDVFHHLDLDADRQLNKEGYTKFVRHLLDLFFPTHLPQLHLDIAAEEWIYRGTTENVGFDTFFEKFFPLPFIFNRDLVSTTENDYAEWWCIVRICLFKGTETMMEELRSLRCFELFGESSIQTDRAAAAIPRTLSGMRCCGGLASPGPRLRRRASVSVGCSFLVPLTNFTEGQIRVLQDRNPAEARICFKSQRASAQGRKEGERGRRVSLMLGASLGEGESSWCGTPVEVEPVGRVRGGKGVGSSAFAEDGHRGAIFHPPRTLDSGMWGSFAEGSRAAAAERVQLESDLDAILPGSHLYQRRRKRLQSAYQRAITRTANTTSSWETFYSDDPDMIQSSPPPVSYEDRLLEFVQDLPEEMFDKLTSLRDRFPIYEAYSEERRRRGLQKMAVWMKDARAEIKKGKKTPNPQYYKHNRNKGCHAGPRFLPPQALAHNMEASFFPLPSPRLQSTKFYERAKGTKGRNTTESPSLLDCKTLSQPSDRSGGIFYQAGMLQNLSIPTNERLNSGRLSSLMKPHGDTINSQTETLKLTPTNLLTPVESLERFESDGNSSNSKTGDEASNIQSKRHSGYYSDTQNNLSETTQSSSVNSKNDLAKNRLHITTFDHSSGTYNPITSPTSSNNSRTKTRNIKDSAAIKTKVDGLANYSKGYRIFDLDKFISSVSGFKLNRNIGM